MAQAVRVYRGNQRTASAKTKTRAAVEGSTRKIFRQKGTGNARHGSVRAPIFVGGGIAHGPSGAQNYKLNMTSGMKKLAVLGALAAKAKSKAVVVLSGVEKANGKTSQVAKLVEKKSLVVTSLSLPKFNLACRNIEGVEIAYTHNLNPYQILTHKKLFIAEPAVKELTTRYARTN